MRKIWCMTGSGSCDIRSLAMLFVSLSNVPPHTLFTLFVAMEVLSSRKSWTSISLSTVPPQSLSTLFVAVVLKSENRKLLYHSITHIHAHIINSFILLVQYDIHYTKLMEWKVQSLWPVLGNIKFQKLHEKSKTTLKCINRF